MSVNFRSTVVLGALGGAAVGLYDSVLEPVLIDGLGLDFLRSTDPSIAVAMCAVAAIAYAMGGFGDAVGSISSVWKRATVAGAVARMAGSLPELLGAYDGAASLSSWLLWSVEIGVLLGIAVVSGYGWSVSRSSVYDRSQARSNEPNEGDSAANGSASTSKLLGHLVLTATAVFAGSFIVAFVYPFTLSAAQNSAVGVLRSTLNALPFWFAAGLLFAAAFAVGRSRERIDLRNVVALILLGTVVGIGIPGGWAPDPFTRSFGNQYPIATRYLFDPVYLAFVGIAGVAAARIPDPTIDRAPRSDADVQSTNA